MSKQLKAPRVQVNVMVPEEAAEAVRKVAAALRDDPGLAERVLSVLGLDTPPPDRLADLTGRVDALEGSLPAALVERLAAVERADGELLQRLDELTARLEQVDAIQPTAAEHASLGNIEVWRHKLEKRMAEFNTRLTGLEMREPEPATSTGATAEWKRKKRTSTRRSATPSDTPAESEPQP